MNVSYGWFLGTVLDCFAWLVSYISEFGTLRTWVRSQRQLFLKCWYSETCRPQQSSVILGTMVQFICYPGRYFATVVS